MPNLVYEKLFVNSKMIIVFLLGIILSGLFLRLYYFPYDIPVSLDAGYYFWYANDLSLSRQFPEHILSTNNAWPTLLSFFFSILISVRNHDKGRVHRNFETPILVSVQFHR